MKLPIVSGKQLIKFLNKQGFEIVGKKGSHVRMKKKTPKKILVTTVPMHKKLDIGTLLGILKQCEINKDKFMEKI